MKERTNKRMIPRCPACNKRVGEWVKEAGYICGRCGTQFEFVDGRVLVVMPVRAKQFSPQDLTKAH